VAGGAIWWSRVESMLVFWYSGGDCDRSGGGGGGREIRI